MAFNQSAANAGSLEQTVDRLVRELGMGYQNALRALQAHWLQKA